MRQARASLTQLSADEKGSGTVTGVGLVSAAIITWMAILATLGLLQRLQFTQQVVDASAIAGADAARGLIIGVGCEIASELALAQGVILSGCQQKDVTVRCWYQMNILGIPVTVQAIAGPPT